MATVRGPWDRNGDDGIKPRLPPCNLDAEQGVLGGILQDPSALGQVRNLVRPEDFFRDVHEVVFRAMTAMEAEGLPLDGLSLSEYLDRKGQLTSTGGVEGIADLMASVPHAANTLYYAQIVREKAISRQLIETASEILREGYSNNFTCDQLLDSAKRRLLRIEQEEPGWGDPDPIGGPAAPPFPLDEFPDGFQRFVLEVAGSIPCPPDFVAVSCLGVASAAMGRSVAVRAKRGWTEEGNLWCAIVGMPGTAKTPALKAACSPLYAIQEELLDKHHVDCEYVKLRNREAAQQKKALGKMGAAGEPEEPLPTLRRLLVSDATAEALGPRLRDNPRGMAMVCDELAGWINGMNQYKPGGNDCETYLALWSRHPLVIDRKGQEGGVPIYVGSPYLVPVGGIQPDKLEIIGTGPDGKRRRDGFVDRMLFSFPSQIPIRWRWEEVSDEAKQDWADVVRHDCTRDRWSPRKRAGSVPSCSTSRRTRSSDTRSGPTSIAGKRSRPTSMKR